MLNLYNLIDHDGDILGLINTSLDSATVNKMWEDYYLFYERNEASDNGEVEVFVQQILDSGSFVEQVWIEDVTPCQKVK